MGKPAFLATVWRLTMIIVVLGMSAPQTAVGQSSGELDISVEVVPAPAPDRTPGDPGAPSGQGDGNNTYFSTGAVGVGLQEVRTVPSPGQATTTVFDLVVVDPRQSAQGWVVTLEQQPDAAASPPVLDRYVRRTQMLDGQELEPVDGPRGVRLSLGQPLRHSTPIIVAQPGAGAGTYWIRFSLVKPAEYSSTTSLIVSTTSAP